MCVCVYPEARNPHRIRWQSGRSRYEAIPSGTNKTWHKLSIRTQVLRLFVCANKKKQIYICFEWDDAKQNPSGPSSSNLPARKLAANWGGSTSPGTGDDDDAHQLEFGIGYPS